MDVMVDIETFSQRPTATVIAIAAIKFDPLAMFRGKAESTFDDMLFFAPISVKQARLLGHTDPETVDWWERKEPMLKEIVLNGTAMPLDVYNSFFNFCVGCDRIWAKSPTFDCIILRHLASQLGQSFPFSFRDERDVRTMLYAASLLGYDFETVELDGNLPKHHPLGDCTRQVIQVQLCAEKVLTGQRSLFKRWFRG